MKIFNEVTIKNALLKLPGWKFVNNTLERRFVFENFNQAMGFIVQVGLCAATRNHHPLWTNSYTSLQISLTTHDAGGVTKLDIDLAKDIDEIC